MGGQHTGYFYWIRRVKGRLRKTYIPKGDVDRMRRLVADARRGRRRERLERQNGWKLFRELRRQLRETRSR